MAYDIKKTLLALSITLVPAFSSSAQANEVCQEISQLAGWVMVARQEGLSAAEMARVSNNALEGYGQDYHVLVKAIIEDAFKVPRYLSQQDKTYEIQDFTLQYYQSCEQAYATQ